MFYDFSRILRWLALASFSALALSACGGSSSSDDDSSDSVTVSGTITFDRIPFKDSLGTGLDPKAPIESPAREVTVQAINASTNAVLASTTTDAEGHYSLNVPASTSMFIRARAEMIKTGAGATWNFSVHNNTNGDALYVLKGEAFDSGTSGLERNLHAESGWIGTGYDKDTRHAAPFAILDTVYQAKQLVLSADSSIEFPPLELFWSPENKPTQGQFCPDDGDITTTFYVGDNAIIGDAAANTSCSPNDELPTGIYILGSFEAGDTDEFDQHVIAHEFGHYVEDRFSRSDSVGGDHTSVALLDMRVAFSEGWGNAYSAMTLNDPVYRDSSASTASGSTAVDADAGFDLEADLNEADDNSKEGWFSEFSVGEILWDIFDPAGESGDEVDLGFEPIFTVMRDVQASTDALTSIFSFAAGLRDENPDAQDAIDDLLSGEMIAVADEFGTGETNDGGDKTVLPLYPSISLNTPLQDVCSTSTAGSDDGNKLGNNRFLVFENEMTRVVTIQARGAVSDPSVGSRATDPDIFVYRQGLFQTGESAVDGEETLNQLTLDPGTYIIEVFDFDLTGTNQTRCMTVSITGPGSS